MLPPKTTQIHIAHETGARKTAVVSFSIPPNQHIDHHGFSPSSLRASREIHDHHRVANWRHFVVQCRSIDELYEANGLRHHGARRVRLSTSSLKQLGVNPTYTNPKRFSNNGLNQIVIFHASVNPATDALLGGLEWAVESPTITHSSADWWDLFFPWHRHPIEGPNGFFCLIRKTLAKRGKRNCQSSEAKSFYRSVTRTFDRPVAGRCSNPLGHRAPVSCCLVLPFPCCLLIQ